VTAVKAAGRAGDREPVNAHAGGVASAGEHVGRAAVDGGLDSGGEVQRLVVNLRAVFGLSEPFGVAGQPGGVGGGRDGGALHVSPDDPGPVEADHDGRLDVADRLIRQWVGVDAGEPVGDAGDGLAVELGGAERDGEPGGGQRDAGVLGPEPRRDLRLLGVGLRPLGRQLDLDAGRLVEAGLLGGRGEEVVDEAGEPLERVGEFAGAVVAERRVGGGSARADGLGHAATGRSSRPPLRT
jgi:hypothetical protein